MRKHFSGILLATGIGLVAFFISKFTPSFINSYLLALVLGMLLAPQIVNKTQLSSGINWSGAKMLEWSVILLAFGIDYHAIAQVGFQSFISIAFVIFAILFLTINLSKWLSCPAKSGWLIGFGTAICGSSAIAALAPKIKAKEEDVAISLATVNLLGSLGMLLLPILFQFYPLLVNEMAFLIGASLHSVGNVAGAGYAVSEEVGQLALVYKMARVALLSPALILMSWLDAKGQGQRKVEWKLPWYLIGFLLISMSVSIFPLSDGVIEFTEFSGKLVLTIAMAAIGLKVHFKQLLIAGKRGLLFAVLIFLLQIGLLFLLK
ncbi:MAG: hypothetical protein RLZZ65_963 [Bacteroidota bacterium]|jgi:uncharacterized integral membrane protein (TIGR00698 family)